MPSIFSSIRENHSTRGYIPGTMPIHILLKFIPCLPEYRTYPWHVPVGSQGGAVRMSSVISSIPRIWLPRITSYQWFRICFKFTARSLKRCWRPTTRSRGLAERRGRQRTRGAFTLRQRSSSSCFTSPWWRLEHAGTCGRGLGRSAPLASRRRSRSGGRPGNH